MTMDAGSTLKPAGETATGDFEPEQKRYLEGFVAGLQIAKTVNGVGAPAAACCPSPAPSAAHKHQRDALRA